MSSYLLGLVEYEKRAEHLNIVLGIYNSHPWSNEWIPLLLKLVPIQLSIKSNIDEICFNVRLLHIIIKMHIPNFLIYHNFTLIYLFRLRRRWRFCLLSDFLFLYDHGNRSSFSCDCWISVFNELICFWRLLEYGNIWIRSLRCFESG